MRDHPCTLHNPALISCSSPKEDPTPRAPNTSPSQRSNMSSISVCFHGTHHITEHKYWRASYVRSNIASTCEEIVPNILAFRREKKKRNPTAIAAPRADEMPTEQADGVGATARASRHMVTYLLFRSAGIWSAAETYNTTVMSCRRSGETSGRRSGCA